MAQYRGAVIGLGWMGMLYDLAKRTGTWHGTTLIAQRPSSTSIGSSIFTIIPARKVCPRPTPRHCGTGHRQQRGSLADPLPSGCQPREIGNPAGARRRRRGGGADPARHRGTGRGRCLRLRRSHVAPSRNGDRYGCFAAQALFHRCRQPTRAPSIWRPV